MSRKITEISPIQLLFLSTEDSIRSRIAAAFAAVRLGEQGEIVTAGSQPAKEVHPHVHLVLAEFGVSPAQHSPRHIDDVLLHHTHITIALSDEVALNNPMVLPGQPAMVCWRVSPISENAELDVFRAIRDEIKTLVDDFFNRGYFSAFIDMKQRSQSLLDALSEGIIAHDNKRRIFAFNRSAEEITGISRNNAIGKDCESIFEGGLSGDSSALFDLTQNDDQAVSFNNELVGRDGERRWVEVKVNPIASNRGEGVGVVASMRNITREHNLARRLGEKEQFRGMVGRDKSMLEVFDVIRTVADSKVPVLVQGKSGTGKELVAAAIHSESKRSHKLFVPINCGALPENLLESELFGHVRGAFTGAVRDKKGRFEVAHEGTLFLDEIGDISMAMQVKLLRVLQEGTFEKVGSTSTSKTDVRIISATNKNLSDKRC